MQTEFMNVTGMTCGGCVSKVEKAFNAISGVKDVKVSLAAASATVQFDERLVTHQQLISTLEHAGYGAAAAHRQAAKGGLLWPLAFIDAPTHEISHS